MSEPTVAMKKPLVYQTVATAVSLHFSPFLFFSTTVDLLWMAGVHDPAGSWALVSHKELHIWARPLIPVQPWHMGGFDQPHVHHPSWHLQAVSDLTA